MDFFSLVLHPGDEVHGWGGIRVDSEGTWFEPSHAIDLAYDPSGRQRPRWPHAVRLEGHDPSAVPTETTSEGLIRDHATITGTWRGDSILVASTDPVPWLTADPELPRPPRGRRNPRSSPELAAAIASFEPHQFKWTYAFSSQWMDPQDKPHYSIGVCRVIDGMAAWATAHPAVSVHFRASLLPVGIGPVAAAGGWRD